MAGEGLILFNRFKSPRLQIKNLEWLLGSLYGETYKLG